MQHPLYNKVSLYLIYFALNKKQKQKPETNKQGNGTKAIDGG